jgi:hypothetical protein
VEYSQYKRFEKVKQIEELIEDINDGMFDDLLRGRFGNKDDFGNRIEMNGILTRMKNQLIKN